MFDKKHDIIGIEFDKADAQNISHQYKLVCCGFEFVKFRHISLTGLQINERIYAKFSSDILLYTTYSTTGNNEVGK